MNKYKVSGFRSIRDKERFCKELTYEIRISSHEMRGITFESEKEIEYLMDKVKNKNICQGLTVSAIS